MVVASVSPNTFLLTKLEYNCLASLFHDRVSLGFVSEFHVHDGTVWTQGRCGRKAGVDERQVWRD